MLVYEVEGKRIRELNAELAEIVGSHRDYLKLDEVETCFFLLLGQSLSGKVLPKKPKIEGEAHARVA